MTNKNLGGIPSRESICPYIPDFDTMSLKERIEKLFSPYEGVIVTVQTKNYWCYVIGAYIHKCIEDHVKTGSYIKKETYKRCSEYLQYIGDFFGEGVLPEEYYKTRFLKHQINETRSMVVARLERTMNVANSSKADVDNAETKQFHAPAKWLSCLGLIGTSDCYYPSNIQLECALFGLECIQYLGDNNLSKEFGELLESIHRSQLTQFIHQKINTKA